MISFRCKKGMIMMKCNVRGEKIKITEAIGDYIDSKIGRLDKYFKEEVSANILVKTRGKKDIIEVTIPTSQYVIRGEEEHDDLYAAIDLVTDKLERMIRKNKTKIKKKETDKSLEVFNLEFEYNKEEKENNNVIVKRKSLEMKPMDEEEAILELELLGHEFFVYKDVDSGNINVIYKRKDGNYGVIETN
jgi:putative sigma-54 modulation protein